MLFKTARKHNGPEWALLWLHRLVCRVFGLCELCGDPRTPGERICGACWHDMANELRKD